MEADLFGVDWHSIAEGKQTKAITFVLSNELAPEELRGDQQLRLARQIQTSTIWLGHPIFTRTSAEVSYHHRVQAHGRDP